jgi:hypothetical protein
MTTFKVILVLLSLIIFQKAESQTTCITAEEKRLYKLINEYRQEKGLEKITLSVSLTIVAQTHVKDLEENNPDKGNCNLHSWSDKGKGKWKGCCYTDDHKKATCMWDKPKELTNYQDYGFEISCQGLDADKALSALNMWKSSSAHNAVIINEGIWKTSEWKAVGVGIYGDYAVVWFGKETDEAGTPADCK